MDVFYLRCVSKKPADGDKWYECSPVGKEKLRKFMEVMCREAGISEKKTNHSLRATGATALFSAGVPERMIRDVTWHRSNALQLYERPSLTEKEAVSSILVQGTRSFTEEVEKLDGTGPCSVGQVQMPRCPMQRTSTVHPTHQ